MGGLMRRAGEKAHERRITVSTYEAGRDRVIIEGRLVDDRLNEYYLVTGEKRPPGEIHHMVVRLLVHTNTFAIEDVEVEMVRTPRDECRELQGSLGVIKGERIVRGFSRRMRDLLGGVRGCTHLLALLLDMGPAALQGIFSNRARSPMDVASMLGDPARTEFFLATLLDTCRVWRKDGPAMKRLKRLIDAARKGKGS
ncbi:MAG: DUF2889 domain-containing protein [Spirochaetes bacterium]|nr:DUF2889 domain-containing protein [Spirochaetota bacterium]